MGLSNFHSQADGVLPLLVMNTVLSLALIKNMIRSVFQVVGANTNTMSGYEEESGEYDFEEDDGQSLSLRSRVMVRRFNGLMEEDCCVCLCKFKEEEEVSELSNCHHFFHKICLDKWFDNHHTTCPLCRSTG